jgi:hypothetical protein
MQIKFLTRWPSAVALTKYDAEHKFNWVHCSATLIHPEVVVYSAECGTNNGEPWSFDKIFIGNSTYGKGRYITPEFCKTYPRQGGDSDWPADWAFCKLSEPVTDVATTPPLMDPELAFTGPFWVANAFYPWE